MKNVPAGPLPSNAGCRCWVHELAALLEQIDDARRCLTAAQEGGDESAANAVRLQLDQLRGQLSELEQTTADYTLAALQLVRQYRPAEYADHLAKVDPLEDALQRLEEVEGAVADLQAGDLRGGAR